ncbi:MAG: hypothetical protein Q8L07_04225 [Sediminibacterium sp.]|nr:hypothetical protein [Sediminibacterium sp.]
MCNKLQIKNFELVKLTMVTGQSVYELGNNSTIANAKKVVAFRIYYGFTGTMKDPDGGTLVGPGTVRSGYFVISSSTNIQPINNIPLMELAMMPNTDNPQEMQSIDVKDINPSKCKVVLGDIAGFTAGQTLLVGVIYEI